MTKDRTPVDDSESLRRILANTDALLLDFDGPVGSVFAGLPAPTVADHLRDILAQGGYSELPPDVAKAGDPFDVFRYAAELGPDEAHYVEAALRAHEVEAMSTAAPTPGAHDLIRAWHATGRQLAIVSNNSTASVKTYLHRHKLITYFGAISARNSSGPALLKPATYLLDQVTRAISVPAQRSTLVGDSLNDLFAAKAAGALAIGYANKPGKSALFADAGADAITTSMVNLGYVLRLL
ncbi:HAD hydrolase-like protein [Solihabitans fulvus]|uniref:HAD hydrolase-like protein n=1 Tax=Solihabitans fulvus TaxID=1892852 RepID=A0A5B2XTJ3_9PSEU|nr:HAD hydrolase-like protein [Solihabitans fulvus]KAA2266179.1 HAD hydrolase-like protein [Solihabitans fulvus]